MWVAVSVSMNGFARIPHQYVGVDKNDTGVVRPFIQSDYTDLSFLENLPFAPNAFVSLFSIEACLPKKKRYRLYEELFERADISIGLSAGFYYESKKDQDTVGETGGIISYQTIEPLEYHDSDVFEEMRIVLKTPSAMFGPDVVEVWKILTRR